MKNKVRDIHSIEKLAAYSTAKATGPCQDCVAEEAADGARNVA